MQPEPKSVERKIGDKVFKFETGRFAAQAGGAVIGVGATIGVTIARRVPLKRLNSVDLPTLGRPTRVAKPLRTRSPW